MKNFIESTMVIDEAKATVKKRNFWATTGIFMLVYLVTVMAISCIMSVIFIIYAFLNNDAAAIFMDLTNEAATTFNLISLFLNIFIIVIPILYCTLLERRRLFTLGFTKKGAISEYLSGLLIGFVMFAAAFGIIYLCGGFVSVKLTSEIPWGMLVVIFVGFIIQGMSEEVMVRGYYMVSLATNGNIPLAIFASSVIFAALHLFNSGISVMGIINLILFGILAALYFIRRGNIWGIAALHTIWNFAQGNIFGCLVSGTGFGQSVLETEINHSASLINGGDFGPEGGLAVTIVFVVCIVILYFMKNKERSITIK